MRKKEKRTEINQSKKTSRAKYQCPPLLSEIIEDVNRLPKNTSRTNKNQEIGYVEGYNYSKSIIEFIQDFPLFVNTHKTIIQKAFNKYFSPLGFDAKLHIDLIVNEMAFLISSEGFEELGLRPKELATFLYHWFSAYVAKKGEDSLDDLVDFSCSIAEIQSGARNLKRLIRYKNVAKKRKKINLDKIEAEAFLVMRGTTVQTVKSRFFEAIENVDTDRIRICDVCENIFWATRFDSKTCSKQCYNTFRQRQFREKNREELNANRRSNYAYKKSINKNKE